MKNDKPKACRFSWCEKRDLNPYGVIHTPLKRARLPVPPLSRVAFDNANIIPLSNPFVNTFFKLFSDFFSFFALSKPNSLLSRDTSYILTFISVFDKTSSPSEFCRHLVDRTWKADVCIKVFKAVFLENLFEKMIKIFIDF